MRAKNPSSHTLRLSLGAAVVAVLLAAIPIGAHAEDLAPAVVPVVTSAAMPPGTVGEAYDYQLTSNVSPVTFSVSGLPDGLTADAGSGSISGTPTTEGEFAVRLEAIGAEPTESTQVRYDTVVIAPAPVTVPVITSPPLPAGTVGVVYSFQLTSNVSPVTFSVSGLPDGLIADAQSGLISGTPLVDGEFAVRLEAVGGGPAGDTQVRYDTLVVDPAPVTVPVITSPALPAGTVSAPYSFQLTSNVSPVTFSVSGLPDGLTADAATGLITGTPTVEGEFAVRLEAIGTGPTGDVSQVVYQTLVIALEESARPVITSGAPPTATVGVSYSFQVTADGDGLTFGAGGLPDGLTIDPTSGLISGVPRVAGTFSMLFRVVDAAGQLGGQHQSLLVEPAVPVITSGPLPDATVGVAYSFPVQSSVPRVRFAATGLPSGLDINVITGLISGTPTIAGAATITITATADGVTSAPWTDTITIRAKGTPPVTPPVFTSTPPVSATIGAAFSYIPTVTSATRVAFALTGAVPGLTFDPATGRLSGTPTTAGSYTLTIVAANGALTTTSQTFTLAVSVATSPPPTPNPPVPPATGGAGGGSLPSADPASQAGPTGRGAHDRSASSATLADTGASSSGSIAAGLAAVLLLAAGAAIAMLSGRSRRRA
ncbi:Ig domain-containing protein [Herbiconiux ginsengi]|uniref:Putative Ig domain-containing protein n=1 Tax=Herbiconiux ginsengi TaxID=381665 RepID=A0A1H3LW91_9MICO|nr:Ig domain-containing protein [Herbiconiux ginsengi]SDY68075.1 Putative Ig domain-containing protein [Herbiconiux ginsengi]